MTATLFQAARPPVCFVLAGSEGGMKRAIGCSYDWTTATLYRETVLRMETPIQDRMFRVGRVKIGFNRGMYPVKGLHEVGEAKGILVDWVMLDQKREMNEYEALGFLSVGIGDGHGSMI